MDIYREELLDHYHNPRNFGSLKKSTHHKALENVSCGDAIAISLEMDGDNVKDIAFTGEGCAIAISAASMLTEHLKGKDIDYVNKFSLEDLLKLMHTELTPSRIKCAYLSLETVKSALNLKIDQF